MVVPIANKLSRITWFAYLKGRDAESQEAQENANSSSLVLYA